MQPITLNFTDVIFVHAHIDFVDHAVFTFVRKRYTVDLEPQKLIDFVTVLFEFGVYAYFVCV